MALALSEMPAWVVWPAGAASIAHGVRLARRELARPVQDLVVSATGETTVDGVPVEAVRVRWRGALAFVEWCGADGRMHRIVATPDTLPPSARRELRLASSTRPAAHSAAAVAP